MYLVIGGTGTTGREVVRLLAARGETIRVLVRDPFKASFLAAPGVELVQGDLSRPAGLPGALEGTRRLFLVTPPAPDMVALQTAAVEAAKAAGVDRLVRVSVLGAGAGIPMQLATWHTEVEELVDASGIPAVHLRPASFMQNFLASAGLIRATGQIFGTSGDGKITFVDTRDVAAAGVGALTRADHQNEKVEIGGPAALSLDDVAATFASVLGRPVTHVDLPAEAMKAGLMGAGLPEWLAADLVSYHGLARGKVMPVAGDVLRLAGAPARSFETFIRDHRAAFA
jgi:uncharacterized protein YbjT (DUF2867 family)